MEFFNTWWDGLSLTLKIYWLIAIPFTLFFLLQLVLSFLGTESADDLPDSEIDSDHGHGIGFQFFTLKNMIGFFTIFGWTGIACTTAGWSLTATLFTSTLAGIAMMGVMAGLFYLLMKASSDGTLNFHNAINKVGEVYLTIPSRRSGLGKIQINIQKSIRTLDAMTDEEQEIATGKVITVRQVIGDNILLVTSK